MDLVKINDGKAVTTSNLVADYFGKRHSHVLDKIKQILVEVPKEFSEPNFRLADYIDEQGKLRPCYEITKDGFTLLAMGFTGKKAMEFKINYINAFNEMTDFILNNQLSLQQQFLVAEKEFKTASEIASHAGYTLNHVGKNIKPVKKRIRDTLLEQLQIMLPFVDVRTV